MLIKSIYVDGYRSLKDFKIENLNRVNIFYGDNNTGKSNIIKALELFFSEKEKKSTDEDFELSYEIEGGIKLLRSDFFKNRKEKIIFELSILLDDDDISNIKKLLYGASSEIFKIFKKNNNVLFLKAEVKEELEDEKTAEFKLISIHINETDLQSKSSKVDYRPLVLSIKQYILHKFKKISTVRQIERETYKTKKQLKVGDNNIQSYLFDLKHSHHKEKQILFRQIEKSFSDFHGNIGDLEFSLEPAGYEKEQIKNDGEDTFEYIKTPLKEIKINIFSYQSDLFLPIDNIGSGLKQTIIILSNILSNRGAKIFGIEELELNLSPKNQKLIFEKLLEFKDDSTSGFDQLFLTSHSPVFENIKKKNCMVNYIKLSEGVTEATDFSSGKKKDFFNPYTSPEYKIQFDIQKKLLKIYKKYDITPECEINNECAIDFIDGYVMKKITKKNLFNDDDKIDEIIKTTDEKLKNEWKIIRNN